MTEKGVLLVAGNHTHQEMYGRAFAADPRAWIVGVTDEPDAPPRRRELNAAFAAELDVPLIDDFDAAVAREDVTIVSIAAEPERRAGVIRRCLDAGKHVYVDKQPATTVEDAKSVAEAVAAVGVRSQVFSLVRGALAQRAKRLVDSGELGELVGLHGEMTFAKGPAGFADLDRVRVESPRHERFTWIDSKRESYCVGWYPLVLFQWLTGKRFESVRGTTANYFFAEHQRNDAEDFASLLLGMQDGVEASITVGRTGWASHPDFGLHRLHLVGTRDVVTLDEYEPRVEVSSHVEPWSPPSRPHPEDPMGFWASTKAEGDVREKRQWFPIREAVRSDAAAFLDALEADRESDVPLATGVHTLEVILAGYVAAAEGREVTL